MVAMQVARQFSANSTARDPGALSILIRVQLGITQKGMGPTHLTLCLYSIGIDESSSLFVPLWGMVPTFYVAILTEQLYD